MKLLLDEMLSPAIARELRSRGHDVRSVSGDPDAQALTDPAVFDLALAEQRTVVTNNVRDFRPLYTGHLRQGQQHHGIVFMSGSFKRRKADSDRICRLLESLLNSRPNEDGLRNQEHWLS